MKLRHPLVSICCAGAFALLGCGSSDNSKSGSTGLVNGSGQHCGGNVANPPQCPDGYQCVPDPNSTLPFGDVGGICQPNPTSDAGAAQHCGGNTANAPTCPAGYECVPDPNSTLPFGDVGGICQPMHCGGNMANPPRCPAGFQCVPDPNSTLPFGDVGGICQKQ